MLQNIKHAIGIYKVRIFLSILIGMVLLYVSNPYPTQPLNLAIGQQGSSYHLLGNKIASYLKSYGIEVNLIDPSGMQKGVDSASSKKSSINAAFMTAGQTPQDSWTNLVSLGSVQYSPLWLFYHGQKPENELQLFRKKIAIGADNTNTQALFRTLAEGLGYSIDDKPNFLKLKHSDAVNLFNAGMIDAIFIVDGIDSENIQNLLENQRNHIFSFDKADAYIWQFPYLNKMVIPKGALNLREQNPNDDVTVLESSMTLLVEKDTHPYIQWLLLKAVRDIQNNADHRFAPINFFPARLDGSIKMSEIAERYYNFGFPELSKYMPLWIAIYLDRIWFVLLSFLAVILPFRQIWSILRELSGKDNTH